MENWMQGKSWVEYLGITMACVGLWLDGFVKEITGELRILRIVLMALGILLVGIYEYANRHHSEEERIQRMKKYTDEKLKPVIYYCLMGIYGAVIIYAAAFEKNELLLVMVLVLFGHVIIYNILLKQFQNRFLTEQGYSLEERKRILQEENQNRQNRRRK